MLKQVLLVVFLLSASPSIGAQVKYQMDCDLGKGTTQKQKTNGSTVILTPSDGMCHVTVLDAGAKVAFEYSASGMQVFVGVGVTTDGRPNAVIQADTFSPYRLFIVSLGEHARLLRTIENQYGFWLQNDCGGRIRIWTADGAFQKDHDLDDVYHRDLFTPDVVFELENDRLVDATPSCREYFDKEASSLRSQLKEDEVKSFQAGRIADEFHRGQVKGKILKIVFCYLYTGRENDARQFLQQTWPSSDAERLWKSIVKLRSEGVLSNVTQAQL
ncbi:MAG TPA: hypothetical protein VMH20_08430 [Verrucomicrobiae bacterium]|nr:hypothetical protein [Verrucomicrobiae bacterium]